MATITMHALQALQDETLGATTGEVCPGCGGDVLLFGGAAGNYIECPCGAGRVLA